jgi:hypothetical protein
MEVQKELNELMETKEMGCRQCAKVHWLKGGDKNSKFFHTSVNQRRRANYIHSIIDERSVECSTMEEVVSGFTDYFHAIFTTSNLSGIEDYIAGIKKLWMGP